MVRERGRAAPAHQWAVTALISIELADNAVGPPDPDPGPASLTADDARGLVVLHVAATLVPSASLTQREQIRVTWDAALAVIWDRHDVWAIAYAPGVHHGDNETYAVHKTSGRVVGGDCRLTRQEHGESTEAWLSRLDA